MLARLLTAAVLIPVAVVLIFNNSPIPFAVAIGLFSVLGVFEFYGGCRRIGAKPIEWAGAVAVMLFVVSALQFEPRTITSIFPSVLTVLLIVSFCVEFARRDRAPIINIGTTIFGAIYVGWMISQIIALRSKTGFVLVGDLKSDVGSWLVMMTFVGTWACDTAAYFVGKHYGRTPMAPHLSPHKTVEGAVAGLVGSIMTTFAMGVIIHLPLGHTLALGALFGILSQIGDLSESAVKRELHIKDFGNLIPGHGGVLDRFDSLLFCAPAAYYYVTIFLKDWPR